MIHDVGEFDSYHYFFILADFLFSRSFFHKHAGYRLFSRWPHILAFRAANSELSGATLTCSALNYQSIFFPCQLHVKLTGTLRFLKIDRPCVEAKQISRPCSIQIFWFAACWLHCHIFCVNNLLWVFLSKVFICQKEVWGYAKKRETHEALKLAKEKRERKNGTHEGSKVLKKERDSPHF
jgi:hypothetical protein